MSLVGKFVQVSDSNYEHYKIGRISECVGKDAYLVQFDTDHKVKWPRELVTLQEMIQSHPEYGRYWLFFDSYAEIEEWQKYMDTPLTPDRKIIHLVTSN